MGVYTTTEEQPFDSWILKISNRAFIKLVDDNVIITQDPEKATCFAKPGNAMKIAAKLNEDWETNIVKFIKK